MTLRGKNLMSSFIFTLSALGLQACADNKTTTAQMEFLQVDCEPSSTSVRCLLESAGATLMTIEDGFDWVTSAAELAIAMDSVGDNERAWSLMSDAVDRLVGIDDTKKRGTAIADIALALKSFKKNDNAKAIINSLRDRMVLLGAGGVKTDIECKLVTAIAIHESPQKARKLALALSQEDDTANAYRGRTQREIAAIFAKKGDFEAAMAMLDEITADFDYYKAIAHTDVMSAAAKAGKSDIVMSLKDEAESIANSQENSYFSAGILRDIGHSFFTLGDARQGKMYMDKALNAAKAAPKFQEKARSTSRIATRLSDVNQLDETSTILAGALALALQEESELMQNYSFYEIVGSAAFSGNMDMAKTLLEDLPPAPFGSASSLKAAGQRDLAWGLVRSGKTEQGIAVASAITAPREKVHAFSRIIRLLENPKMDPLPRYL